MPNGTQAPANAEGPTQHTQNQGDRPAGTYGYTRPEQIEALRKLREPFPEQEIRFLARMWCKNCKDSRGRGCDNHPRRICRTCQQNLPGGHIDLRYVGHAEATNRLLNVDPFWDWEPLAPDANGLPQYDGNRGLWIRLTVCGMTRLGYGHAGDKSGGDAVKEIIGDAIRNAGMRFGMALDLWTTSDLEKLETEGQTAEPGTTQEEQTRTEQRNTRPASAPSRNASAAAPDEEAATGPEPLEALMGKVRNSWHNALGMKQNVLEGKKLGVLDVLVPDGKSGSVKLGDLMQSRIDQLEADSQERNAA